jgi:hypothetical protein
MLAKATLLIWAASAVSLISGTIEEVGALAEKALGNVQSTLGGLCTAQDLAIRREWYNRNIPNQFDMIYSLVDIGE